VASVHPGVGLALADALDWEAERIEKTYHPQMASYLAEAMPLVRLARVYLGRQA
jgi:hypothetical protein